MIGKNIQGLRKKKGLTLSELAIRATISKSYLSNIERNINTNPSVQIMEKIAAVLDVDLRTLIESNSENQAFPEGEWLDFVNDLKESGVEKEQLQEFKTVIEFAKWQKNNLEGK
ncbi:helix-turn-helix domain-containing protein [Virgibacillus necropolis]|uniref:Transcriptional regulator n=1 Tax=Virgibacillus necropolis TaxID=163877 RepID=A0A221MEA2_9BACI|nr:helix-turn-helix transcriptional regulator [Virgibacillus necropolis]ASN05993.1 transcriptional regulator [Virgibacillus necropolis]